ncbi:hypothetical protein BX616_003485 [Lobosporangium transversale]|uniref:CRAL-TRIO domain-containing protein n=1 Tax=Lobosporangium transversale TaxID=64571 RepID=A0A1Y2GY89_9FUNG|nr:CRAL-TRIO domain-containing protein [Lobosporangium transversale]KAF9898886.1 hypothetical protein BX616_003485 [Lobosporangium transversale]ORZ27270.1 CRAL-TRIO domain-containing protein [Lobosporangium transversale]|eukprot:XP_021884997.1 CRAL-TRIO domain-containing protein [Lobosporangium transversale]
MAKGDIATPPGTGYIGCLTPDQKVLLKQMWAQILQLTEAGIIEPSKDLPSSDPAAVGRISLKDLGLDKEHLRPALWNNILGDHPDSLLLRFLRARKWNVTNGLNMILKAFKWRIEDDIEEVKAKNEDELSAKYRGFKLQLEMGKSYFHGTDKMGRPVVYINVRLHKPADQDQKALEKFTIYVMETGRLMIQPPVETACLVFDMTGFGLSNMDYNFVKFLVQCFEAYYPESLGILIVHKAPLVFWGVWKVIEPWLDPVVASKIRFTRSDKELLEIIDPNHLPAKYDGGKDNFTYKYVSPVPGENECMNDAEMKDKLTEEWKSILWKFEAVTQEWIQSGKTEGGRSEAEIEQDRTQLASELRVAYFKLDPYIRARTLYHRSETPVLQRDGTSTWTYSN